MLDWYPQPEAFEWTNFEEPHEAWIFVQGVDVCVLGSYVHADPTVGAPAGWRIEEAHAVVRGETIEVELDEYELGLAEDALEYAREWLS